MYEGDLHRCLACSSCSVTFGKDRFCIIYTLRAFCMYIAQIGEMKMKTVFTEITCSHLFIPVNKSPATGILFASSFPLPVIITFGVPYPLLILPCPNPLKRKPTPFYYQNHFSPSPSESHPKPSRPHPEQTKSLDSKTKKKGNYLTIKHLISYMAPLTIQKNDIA